MTSADKTSDQTEELAGHFSAWLDEIDPELAELEVSLPQRPLQALIELLQVGAVVPHVGQEPIALDRLTSYAEEVWFKALYAAVERWYVNTFGAEAIRGKGNAPLDGVILIRGVAYAISVPTNRGEVVIPGKQAWMYFEEGLGEGEDALDWVVDAPDLSRLDSARRNEVEAQALKVASALRLINFRRLGFGRAEPDIRSLVLGARGYIQQAARKIVGAKPEDRGPAWFDLQMAIESALKLVIRNATGDQPKKHEFSILLPQAAAHGLVFDPARFSTWPSFPEISDYRYLQGTPGGVERLFQAYLLALDLVVAVFSLFDPPLQSGAGLLLRYAPWKADA